MKYSLRILLCMLFIYNSYSQENTTIVIDTTYKKSIKLDEVIVVGNIKTDPVLTLVSRNYSKQIVQPKNVTDLFNDINGFSIIKRGNYALDPSFRASQYEQLNVQYDGGTKAMHACPNRMDPITTHIIPEEISKIEIIKGPFSVRYGATFAGIINMVTHRPDATDNKLHGSISGGYEHNGNSFVSLLRLEQVTNNYDISGSLGYRDYGNYKDGNGIEIPSSFRSTDYSIRFGYNLTENQRIQTHWRQSFGRDVLHAGLAMDTDYDDSSILSLDYKWNAISNSIQAFTAKVYYSYVDHLMHNLDRPMAKMTESISAVEATTIGGKFELTWIPVKSITMYSGVDAIFIRRDGNRNRTVKMMNGTQLPNPMEFEDKIWQDAYIHDWGLFSEAKWAINHKTILSAGIRLDIITSEATDPDPAFEALYNLDKRTENNLSGTVSLKHLINNKLSFETAYGRGVRSANMVERFISHFNVGQDPYEYIGNPDLKAEINNQWEIGLKGWQPLEGIFNRLGFSTAVYYSHFENYIVAIIDETKTRKYNPSSPPIHPKVFQNLNKAFKTGFEIMGEIGFTNDISMKLEMAYVYSRNKDLHESLPLTPPLTTKLFFGVEKEKWWANIQWNLVSKQPKIAQSFGEISTKGYQTMDMKFGIKPLKNITLGAAVLNTFDTTYNNHLNFSFTNQADFSRVPITDPGRNITAFLQYQF